MGHAGCIQVTLSIQVTLTKRSTGRNRRRRSMSIFRSGRPSRPGSTGFTTLLARGIGAARYPAVRWKVALPPVLGILGAATVLAAGTARGPSAPAAHGDMSGADLTQAVTPAHDAAHDDAAAGTALAHWSALGRPLGTPSPFPQQAPDTTIIVRTVGETLEFTPTRIAARQGRHVRVRYINGGTLPHNLVVLRDDELVDAIASAAYAAAATGFVPVETHRASMVAWSRLASPGDTVDVAFVMPPPGEYTFICLYPGHASMMFGVLRSLN
jgi:azurin